MRAVCVALVLAVAVSVAGISAASPPPPSFVGYRLTFTGSGTATSAYPPAASNTTIYTTTIKWKLVYDVTIDSMLGPWSGWAPTAGSSVEGSSTGVAAPGGMPVEEGCEHLAFSLDDVGQWGAAFNRRTARRVVISLYVPGFHGGLLIMVVPPKCSDPFPSGGGGPGCPDVNSVIDANVSVDTTRKTQTWKLSGQCDLPDESQTEHWTGTVTATRRTPPLRFDGHTSQRLPISFELKDGTVSDLVAEDKGTCGHGKTSRSSMAPPPWKVDAHGRFHAAYRANDGAYRVQISGRITGTKASGVLSTTSRFDSFSGTLDPNGTVLCQAKNVRWTATGYLWNGD